MSDLIAYISGPVILIIGIILFIKLLGSGIKFIFKLLLNAILGWITLFLVNILLSFFGIAIPVTFVTAVIAGVFGVPGVVVLLVLQLL